MTGHFPQPDALSRANFGRVPSAARCIARMPGRQRPLHVDRGHPKVRMPKQTLQHFGAASASRPNSQRCDATSGSMYSGSPPNQGRYQHTGGSDNHLAEEPAQRQMNRRIATPARRTGQLVRAVTVQERHAEAVQSAAGGRFEDRTRGRQGLLVLCPQRVLQSAPTPSSGLLSSSWPVPAMRSPAAVVGRLLAAWTLAHG